MNILVYSVIGNIVRADATSRYIEALSIFENSAIFWGQTKAHLRLSRGLMGLSWPKFLEKFIVSE
jgi:hypothetical protein